MVVFIIVSASPVGEQMDDWSIYLSQHSASRLEPSHLPVTLTLAEGLCTLKLKPFHGAHVSCSLVFKDIFFRSKP